MERLILAIIAVICLHIGYVAYIYTDRPIVDHTSIQGNHVSPQRPLTGLDETLARLFSDDEIYSTIGGEDEPATSFASKTVARRRSTAEMTGPAVRRVQRYTPPVDPDEISNRGPFRSVTIAIPPPYIPKMPVEAERPAIKTSIQRGEDKSFIAGVLPVIKKPYSWLKALGSKLK